MLINNNNNNNNNNTHKHTHTRIPTCEPKQFQETTIGMRFGSAPGLKLGRTTSMSIFLMMLYLRLLLLLLLLLSDLPVRHWKAYTKGPKPVLGAYL